jgi:SAM-dependent methyltransferase
MRSRNDGYRTRVYEHYVSQMKPELLSAGIGSYEAWSHATGKRLKGWLPTDKDAVFLDLACGPGNVLHLLKSAGYRNVTGVDRSPEQVDLARKFGFEVHCTDVFEFLARRSADTDCIVAFDILEHLTKDEMFAFLDACAKALTPGGSLIIQTPNAESPWGMSIRYGDITHEEAFDPASLCHVLKVTGFGEFEARECGPVVHGVVSFGRRVLWLGIRAGLALWNLAETGSRGSGIHTRVFLARVRKPPA